MAYQSVYDRFIRYNMVPPNQRDLDIVLNTYITFAPNLNSNKILLLLSKGANPNDSTIFRKILLSEYGDTLIKLFNENSTIDWYNFGAVILSNANRDAFNYVMALDVNIKFSPEMSNILMQRITTDNYDLIYIIITKWPNLINMSYNGKTPIFFVENLDIAKLLIDRGAKMDMPDSDGLLPFEYKFMYHKSNPEMILLYARYIPVGDVNILDLVLQNHNNYLGGNEENRAFYLELLTILIKRLRSIYKINTITEKLDNYLPKDYVRRVLVVCCEINRNIIAPHTARDKHKCLTHEYHKYKMYSQSTENINKIKELRKRDKQDLINTLLVVITRQSIDTIKNFLQDIHKYTPNRKRIIIDFNDEQMIENLIILKVNSLSLEGLCCYVERIIINSQNNYTNERCLSSKYKYISDSLDMYRGNENDAVHLLQIELDLTRKRDIERIISTVFTIARLQPIHTIKAFLEYTYNGQSPPGIDDNLEHLEQLLRRGIPILPLSELCPIIDQMIYVNTENVMASWE